MILTYSIFAASTNINQQEMEKLNILVLASGYPTKLLHTITERGHEYRLAYPKDFDLYLSDNEKGYDRVYLNGKRLAASNYDAVITRIGEHRGFASAIIRQLQHNLGLFCVQSGEAIETCANKFKAAQIISEKRLKVPRQIYSMAGRYPAMYADKLGGLPIILKELSGSKGKGLIIMESPLQTNMTLESYYGSERRIILQEFLDNGGTDERHIVCGGKVVNSMKRHAPDDDIRANLSLSGSGEKIEPDDATKKFVIDCCKAIPGLNFAGVDIMKVKQGDDETKYFIEINSNPGEKIIDITGHNHYEDLVEWVEKNYKRKGGVNGNMGATNTTSGAPQQVRTMHTNPSAEKPKHVMYEDMINPQKKSDTPQGLYVWNPKLSAQENLRLEEKHNFKILNERHKPK